MKTAATKKAQQQSKKFVAVVYMNVFVPDSGNPQAEQQQAMSLAREALNGVPNVQIAKVVPDRGLVTDI